MAETLTANYSWPKPDPGASPNTWGTTQNGTIDKIDAQVFANNARGLEIGSGAIWFTNTPPTNWLICDGRSLSTAAPYDKLFAVIGTQFNQSGDAAGTFRLPPMNNVFPYGGNLGAKGGAATVTLDATMIPPHAHSITDVVHGHGVNQWAHAHGIATGGHSHSISTGSHAHGLSAQVLTPNAGGNAGAAPGWGFNTVNTTTVGDLGGSTNAVGNLGGNTDTQTSAISIAGSGTGLSTTNNSTGGGQPHPNMPPYFGVNFIVKYA